MSTSDLGVGWPPQTPPKLRMLLDDGSITDITINSSGEVFFDRGRGMEPGEDFAHFDWKTWLLECLSQVGKSWDARFPFVDARLASGFRLHAALPPVVPNHPAISLRRLPTRRQRGAERWDREVYADLCKRVSQGQSLLITGATGSGKTTLTNDLIAAVPAHERLVVLEDTTELSPDHPHLVSLLSRPPSADGVGEIRLRDLLKQSLRMRPDRIVLGECRGDEVLELLQALNTGHRGTLATLHANSARDALRRLELLCLLAGPLSVSGIRDLIASGIQCIVHVKREGQRRFISEIQEVSGREGDTILLRAVRIESEKERTNQGLALVGKVPGLSAR